MTRRRKIGSMCLTAMVVCCLSVPSVAQERRDFRNQRPQNRLPQLPREQFRGEAKLVGFRGLVMHIVTEGGEQWLVKAPENPLAITFLATAAPAWLQPGMLVRFNANLNKRFDADGPVGDLSVFTPREGDRVGLIPEGAGAAGGQDGFLTGKVEVFADEKLNRARPAVKPQTTAYLVAGPLAKFRKDEMTVVAGGQKIEADLAKDARITVNIADLRFARPGDRVEVEGWYFKGRQGQLYANQLTVTAAHPLGVPIEETKPAANAGQPAADN